MDFPLLLTEGWVDRRGYDVILDTAHHNPVPSKKRNTPRKHGVFLGIGTQIGHFGIRTERGMGLTAA